MTDPLRSRAFPSLTTGFSPVAFRNPKGATWSVLDDVSCASPAICTAVGYRHNPKVRCSYRTLALGWNGSSWTIQKTYNQ